MRATVRERFVDKFTGIQYEVGQTIEVEDMSRILNLEERNLIKVAEKKVASNKAEEKNSAEASATPKKTRRKSGEIWSKK